MQFYVMLNVQISSDWDMQSAYVIYIKTAAIVCGFAAMDRWLDLKLPERAYLDFMRATLQMD